MYTMVLRWLRWNSGSSRQRRHTLLLNLAVLLALIVAAASAPADTFFVGNVGNDTITQIDVNGNPTTFAMTGLNGVRGLAFDAAGNLYAANLNANTIHRFSATGVDQGDFASTGLSGPVGLAFDATGNLYAANLNANTIHRFSPTGVDLGDFATTGLSGAAGLAFDAAGNLYVANATNNTVRRYSPTGDDLGDFASTGLNRPVGLRPTLSGRTAAPMLVPTGRPSDITRIAISRSMRPSSPLIRPVRESRLPASTSRVRPTPSAATFSV
jgi:hypothetical protein